MSLKGLRSTSVAMSIRYLLKRLSHVGTLTTHSRRSCLRSSRKESILSIRSTGATKCKPMFATALPALLSSRKLSVTSADNASCIDRVDTPPDKDWDTYRGQLAIYIADSVTRGSSTVVLKDGDASVTRSITHELGHVFGLGNWKCGNASQVSSMPRIYTSDLTIMGPSNGSCSASIPVFRDKRDFQSSYVPAAPTALGHLSRSPSPNTAIVWWDAYGVHVEKAFAIERENKHGDWEVVATHEPLPLPATEPVLDPFQPGLPLQPTDQIVTGQDPGWQTYRVVALTEAPLQNTVATFGEIRIFVEPAPPPFLICYAPGPDPRSTDPGEPPTSDSTLSAPSNLTVNSVTGACVTLRWADVPEATGYVVRNRA